MQLPDKENRALKFNKFHKHLPFPFVNYADFEAMAEKIKKCAPEQNESYSETYQKHTDCVYGYEIICIYDDRFSKPVQIYRKYRP